MSHHFERWRDTKKNPLFIMGVLRKYFHRERYLALNYAEPPKSLLRASVRNGIAWDCDSQKILKFFDVSVTVKFWFIKFCVWLSCSYNWQVWTNEWTCRKKCSPTKKSSKFKEPSYMQFIVWKCVVYISLRWIIRRKHWWDVRGYVSAPLHSENEIDPVTWNKQNKWCISVEEKMLSLANNIPLVYGVAVESWG